MPDVTVDFQNVHFENLPSIPSNITLDTNTDLATSVKIDPTSKLALETSVKVDPTSQLKLVSDTDLSVKIDPTSQLKLVSDTDLSLKIDPTSKLSTDSGLSLDVRPLVVDLCARVSMGPLPSGCIRMPYGHQIALTLFGMQVFSLSFQGESRVIIDELRKTPHEVWGGETAADRGGKGAKAAEQPHGMRIRLD